MAQQGDPRRPKPAPPPQQFPPLKSWLVTFIATAAISAIAFLTH